MTLAKFLRAPISKKQLRWLLLLDSHVSHLCGKGSKELIALARSTPCMILEKKKIFMNLFLNAV